jgi:hypothetical protein
MQSLVLSLDGDRIVERSTTTASAEPRSVGIEPSIGLVDAAAKEQVIGELVDSIVRRYRRALDKLGRE